MVTDFEVENLIYGRARKSAGTKVSYGTKIAEIIIASEKFIVYRIVLHDVPRAFPIRFDLQSALIYIRRNECVS